jgi:hypothetical protein
MHGQQKMKIMVIFIKKTGEKSPGYCKSTSHCPLSDEIRKEIVCLTLPPVA